MTKSKILPIISYLLLGISTLLGILFYANVITENPFIIWTYFLLGLAVALTLVFSIINIFQSKENAKRSLIYLILVGALVLISYLFASPSIPHFFGYQSFNITPGVSRFVGTGLYMTYICGTLAVLAILYSEIRSALL